MAEDRRWRFTVRDYYAMAEAGILRPDERTELIEGQIFAMSPVGSRHAVCVRRLTAQFYSVPNAEIEVLVQDPIRLSDGSEPEPDVTLVKPGDYRQAHPGPADVLLAVEVSDSTLSFDRRVKIPLYARHGIPEVWIVALEEGKVYVYRTPTPDGYASAVALEAGSVLTVAALDGVEIAAAAVLV